MDRFCMRDNLACGILLNWTSSIHEADPSSLERATPRPSGVEMAVYPKGRASPSLNFSCKTISIELPYYNIIDAGWLEFFADGPNAKFFTTPLENIDELVVPTISIYEVFKSILRQCDESAGLQPVALIKQGQVIDLTTKIRTPK